MGKHSKPKNLNRRQKRLFKFQNFDADTQANILQLAMFTEWLKNVKNINHDDYQNYDEHETRKLLQEYIKNLSSEFRQYNFAGKSSAKALGKLSGRDYSDIPEPIDDIKKRIMAGGRGDSPLILSPEINTNINNNNNNNNNFEPNEYKDDTEDKEDNLEIIDNDYDPYNKDEEDTDYYEKYLDEDDVKEPQYESVSVMDTNIIMPIQRGFMDLAGQKILDSIKWGAETSFSLTDKAQRLLGLEKLGKYTGIPLTLSQIADKLKSDLASNQQIHGNFSAKFECECGETFDTRTEAYKHQIFYQLQRIYGHDYLSSPNYPSIMAAPEEKTELIKIGDGDDGDYMLWQCECGDTFDTKHKAYVHQDIKKLNKEPGHSYLIPSRSYQVQINSGVIECQICKKHLIDSNNKLNRIVHPFGCGHEFHFECLRKYIIKKGKNRNCPLCIRSVKYKNQEEEIDEEDLVKAVKQLLLEKNLPIIEEDEEDEEKEEKEEDSFPLAKALGLFAMMQTGSLASTIMQNMQNIEAEAVKQKADDAIALKQGAMSRNLDKLQSPQSTSVRAQQQSRQYQRDLQNAQRQGAINSNQNQLERLYSPQSSSIRAQQQSRQYQRDLQNAQRQGAMSRNLNKLQSPQSTSVRAQQQSRQYQRDLQNAQRQGAIDSNQNQLERLHSPQSSSVRQQQDARRYQQNQHDLREAEKQGAFSVDQNYLERLHGPQSFSVIGQKGLRNEYEAQNTSPANNFTSHYKSSSESSRPIVTWAENDLPDDSGTSPANNFTSHHKSSSESSRPNVTDKWAQNKNDGKISDLLGSGGEVRDDTAAVKEATQEALTKIAQKEHDERIQMLKVVAVGATVMIGGSVLRTATSIPTSVPVFVKTVDAARQRTHHVAEMLMSASSYLGIDNLGLSTITRMIPGARLEYFKF